MPDDLALSWKTGLLLRASKLYEDARYLVGYKLDTGVPPNLPTKLVISFKVSFKLPMQNKACLKLYSLDSVDPDQSLLLFEESFQLPPLEQLDLDCPLIWQKVCRKVVGEEILCAEPLVAELSFENSNATTHSKMLRFEVPVTILNFLKPVGLDKQDISRAWNKYKLFPEWSWCCTPVYTLDTEVVTGPNELKILFPHGHTEHTNSPESVCSYTFVLVDINARHPRLRECLPLKVVFEEDKDFGRCFRLEAVYHSADTQIAQEVLKTLLLLMNG